MDKVILVESYIEEGRRLIENLDRGGFPVYSALWFLDTSSGTWKLLIATPQLEQLGPHGSYSQISQYMTDIREVLLKDIVVLNPNNNLISLLKSVIQTGREQIAGIRLTNNVINNFF